jgi:hypothetical protein
MKSLATAASRATSLGPPSAATSASTSAADERLMATTP